MAVFLLSLAGIAYADPEPFAESAPFLIDTSTPRIDTDGDGMPDTYEVAVGLNRFVNDANDDADGDGLTNIQEYDGGTNPFVPDFPQNSQGVSALFIVTTQNSINDTDGDGGLDYPSGNTP